MSAMLRRASITIALLGSLACATPTAEQPTAEPAPSVVVETEPTAGPRKLTPADNTAVGLILAADRITRVEVCDVETGKPITTLPNEMVDKLRVGLSHGGIRHGLSSEPAWSMILRVEVEGRAEPFIVQFVTVALRVKSKDAWSLTIADEAGQIDWSTHDIYVDIELELDNDFEALVPDAEPQRPGEEATPPMPLD